MGLLLNFRLAQLVGSSSLDIRAFTVHVDHIETELHYISASWRWRQCVPLQFKDKTKRDKLDAGRHLHNTQQTKTTNIRAISGIRTHDLGIQEAADLRLGPHGHRDPLSVTYRSFSGVLGEWDFIHFCRRTQRVNLEDWQSLFFGVSVAQGGQTVSRASDMNSSGAVAIAVRSTDPEHAKS
jgi:hypothetical protein